MFLQSADEDIHDAVKEIIKLYLGAQPLGPDGIYNADGAIEAYDSQTFFWILWALLFKIARAIPYNHPKQELLVKFLMTLREKKEIATIWLVRVSHFLPSCRIIPTHYIQVYDVANSRSKSKYGETSL